MPRGGADRVVSSSALIKTRVECLIHDASRVRSLEDLDAIEDSVRHHYDFDDPDRPVLNRQQQLRLLNDHLKPRGIKDIDMGPNKIVAIGLTEIWNVWLAKTANIPTYNSVGTSAVAPASGDTQLTAQVERVAITRTFVNGAVANLDTFWNESQGNNAALAETGIHWASSGNNNMYCRRNFSPTKSKTSDDSMTIKWDLTGASVT